MSGKLVCIDSMVFIWGIKKTAHPSQQHLIPLAEALINKLTAEKAQILIPTPVIVELLSPVDDEADRAKLLQIMIEGFQIVPIDVWAANIAAGIINKTQHFREFYQKNGEDGIKNRFKFDTLILAAAIANGANCMYTNDDRLQKLCAEHNMKFIPLENTDYGSLFSLMNVPTVTNENTEISTTIIDELTKPADNKEKGF